VDLTRDQAALTPLGGLGEDGGGYKGYGYAMVVEILSAALSQANFLKALVGVDAAGRPAPIQLGHFFLAMQVEAFCDLADFRKRVGDICRALRASQKAPGAERIWTPGEKEHEIMQYRRARGVPFNQALQKSFRAVKAELGLSLPLPF
jgi:LDH2 family malate/lactate/ureidoglycolate dehydrogenase